MSSNITSSFLALTKSYFKVNILLHSIVIGVDRLEQTMRACTVPSTQDETIENTLFPFPRITGNLPS